MSCAVCSPLWFDPGQSCPFCRSKTKSVFMGIGIESINSPVADLIPASVPNADTKSQTTTGTDLDLYMPIINDVVCLLLDDGHPVDETPLTRMAAMAIEYELAERLTDAQLAEGLLREEEG